MSPSCLKTTTGRLCRNYNFVITFQVTRSVQAKRDTESSIISKFWIPARVPFRVFAGMTAFMALLAIATQSAGGGLLLQCLHPQRVLSCTDLKEIYVDRAYKYDIHVKSHGSHEEVPVIRYLPMVVTFGHGDGAR